jgi:EAL domain-containing protein (putative c-di-GMP-specific phosphodiesterase class I)
VEYDEQRKLLSDVGCDLIQGFLYAKPMPETEFLEWLNEHNQ